VEPRLEPLQLPPVGGISVEISAIYSHIPCLPWPRVIWIQERFFHVRGHPQGERHYAPW